MPDASRDLCLELNQKEWAVHAFDLTLDVLGVLEPLDDQEHEAKAGGGERSLVGACSVHCDANQELQVGHEALLHRKLRTVSRAACLRLKMIGIPCGDHIKELVEARHGKNFCCDAAALLPTRLLLRPRHRCLVIDLVGISILTALAPSGGSPGFFLGAYSDGALGRQSQDDLAKSLEPRWKLVEPMHLEHRGDESFKSFCLRALRGIKKAEEPGPVSEEAAQIAALSRGQLP
mmetsp:Transcript_81561/g.195660  ORF Transcript_81561/g.195660 Transcript_81561/m.195660 type:complete len:233 (+) Transcript_81561:1195-1893(+)